MTWPEIKAILRLGGVLEYQHPYQRGIGGKHSWTEQVRIMPGDPTRAEFYETDFGAGGCVVIEEMETWMDNKFFRLP